MKSLLMKGLLCVSLWPGLAVAQPLEELADRLARQAQGLAESAYRSYSRGRAGRADVEALYLTYQFDSGVLLFQRMAGDGRPETELSAAASLLLDTARNASRYSTNRRQWDDLHRTLDAIHRELGRASGGAPVPNAPDPGRINGRLVWRGRVDQEVLLRVRGSDVSAETVAGSDVTGANSQFTSALPQRGANVRLQRTRGRGSIEIFQHPSRDNDFTAIVRIRDDRGGAGDYEFEMVW